MPPRWPMAMANGTSTTPSMAEAQNGSCSVRSRSWKEIRTSSGFTVTPPGTRATSSKPYARRALLPRPISRLEAVCRVSVSMGVRTPWAGCCAPDYIDLRPSTQMELALLWQGVDGPALEMATAEMGREGLTAHGAWVRAEPEPYALTYRLETTSRFVTSSLTVAVWGAGWSRSLDLRRLPEGTWVAEPGGSLPELGGALDCDLGYSCLTN